MSRSAAVLAVFLLLASPVAALAQRSVSFDAHALPGQGTVAIAVAEGLSAEGSFGAIDARTDGALRRAAELDGFKGKADSLLDLRGFAGYERLLVLGTGKQALSSTALQDIGGQVARATARSRAGRVDLVWDGAEPDAASHLAFGASLGQYRFDKYRSRDGDGDEDAQAGKGPLVIRSRDGAAAADRWAAQWKPVADAVAFARDLATEPANALWPEEFVARVRAAASGLPLRIEVLDVPAMQKLGMGGILAPAHLIQPAFDGRTRGNAFQFSPQEFLHRLALQGGACGEFVPHGDWHIPDGDLDRHAVILTALHAFGNHRGSCACTLASCPPFDSQHRIDRLIRQPVHMLVARIAGVSAHPAPFHLVAVARGIQRLPQVLVLHRLAVGGFPAARLPHRQPLLDAGAHVLRIGEQRDLHRPLERAQRLDGGGQLHAVVGGLRFAAGKLAPLLAGNQQRTPAPGPRISPTGTIGIDDHLAHERWRRVGSGSTPPNTGRRSRCRSRGRSGVMRKTCLRARSSQAAAGRGLNRPRRRMRRDAARS